MSRAKTRIAQRLSTLAQFCEAQLRRVGPQTVESVLGACPYRRVVPAQIQAAFVELVNAGRASFDPDSQQYSSVHATSVRTRPTARFSDGQREDGLGN